MPCIRSRTRSQAIDPGGSTLRLMNKLAKDRLLTPMQGDPGWEDWGHKDLPQLSNYKVPEIVWEMTFGSSSLRAMNTRAYVCDKAMGTPHVGIGWPSGVRNMVRGQPPCSPISASACW